MEVGRTDQTWVITGYKPYYYNMVETKSHFRLDYTSISCICNVFKHLSMQWIAIWMYLYAVKAMEVG